MGRSVRGRQGRRGTELPQVERLEEADFEPGEEQRGGRFDGVRGGAVQDAQQHEGDHRHIDLEAHGILAAPQEAAEFEVLLEPLEEQLDLPAFLVEGGDLRGRPVDIIGQEIERFWLVGAGDDDLAQLVIVERVLAGPGVRPAMAELEPAIGEDPLAGDFVFAGHPTVGVLLRAG
jgi:hypothetical protein